MEKDGVYMVNLSKFIDAIRGRVDLDNYLTWNNSNLLLHISDTPSQFYPELKRIIKLIRPRYIVHTGDLADNIKTEFSPSLLTKYKHEVAKLLDILNTADTENTYITIGNHDDYDFLDKNKGKIDIYTKMGQININQTKFVFSHYWDYLKQEKADIYLYGHDIKQKTLITESAIYLNGIISINLINLDTMEVRSIKYPFGTNTARMSGKRIKL